MTKTVYNVHLKINVHHKSVWYIVSTKLAYIRKVYIENKTTYANSQFVMVRTWIQSMKSVRKLAEGNMSYCSANCWITIRLDYRRL